MRNLYHNFQRCIIVPEHETEDQRAERRLLAKKYKKAIRLSRSNINDQLNVIIAKQVDKIAKAKNDEKRAEGEEILRYHRRQQHELTSIFRENWDHHDPAFHTIQDIPADERFYPDLTYHQRLDFWNSFWTEDLFVSWLWPYQSILHFQANWDDIAVRNMFHCRYMQLVQDWVNKIWSLELLKFQFQTLSPMLTERLHFDWIKPDFAGCYKLFPTYAEHDGFGSYGKLWTTHDPEQKNRTQTKTKK
ncbi:hypothetical protein K491DRAFT_712565 [Lophiostoma macrostomum CBS 122681]|uniref:Uncharacterized protein n=1 Tax=Lophiostoma macrostomum CBS 122681 TaxID=1314788 RepID=A0A6A6TLR8_9PLEO|nr:hypothetical protein K491DRAFT_712565 [Lophiostoma macrostomum CBS 122681]